MIRSNFIVRGSVIPIALATLFLAILHSVNAQTAYMLSPGKGVILSILGSSNVHNWTMNSSSMDSQGDFKFDEENRLLAVSSFSFTVDSKSLKSGHESMDNRTYKAIKADLYPRIAYRLHSALITQVQKNKIPDQGTSRTNIIGQDKLIVFIGRFMNTVFAC